MELVKCKKCGGNELEAKGAFLVCTFCQSKFKRDVNQGLVNCGTCGLSDKTASVGALRAKTPVTPISSGVGESIRASMGNAVKGIARNNLGIDFGSKTVGFLDPPARPVSPMVVKRTWHWVLVVFLWIIVFDFVALLTAAVFGYEYEVVETTESTLGLWGTVALLAVMAVPAVWGLGRMKALRSGWNTEAAENSAAFEAADKNWHSACQRLSEAWYCERCHVLFDDQLSASVDGFKYKIFTV